MTAPSKTDKSPAQLNFRMPAEWEPHDATWLGWPANRTDWPGKFSAIAWAYADIVRYLARWEHVHILVKDEGAEQVAHKALDQCGCNLENISFHHWPMNRVWTRDSGPIFIKNDRGEVAITNWKFNAWAKYDDWQLDDTLPSRIAKQLKVQEWKPTLQTAKGSCRVVLEGGSIDVNGRGSLLTTEECLLSPIQARNPGVSREQIEQAFADYLGVTNTIWLGHGIAGDDTHGHVDDISRFVAADTIVTAVEPDESDYNHAPLAYNLGRLRAARNERGKQFTIVELPLPRPFYFRRQRLPASYANFYIGNGVVLVPTFNDPSDRVALNILAELFPSREVVGIHCGDFIWGLGAIHCATQQQPSANA